MQNFLLNLGIVWRINPLRGEKLKPMESDENGQVFIPADKERDGEV